MNAQSSIASPTKQAHKVRAFLADLDKVSREHGFAVADGATIYIMERDDFARSYAIDDNSEMTFA